MAYLPRIVDAELEARLSAAGAVVIEGPKACGKTETARQRAASSVLLDVDENARRAAAVDPSLVLEGPTPRLLDEWQTEPRIWNHVRRTVDDRRIVGQFILTGSAVPADDVARHTGAGRFSFLRMRPMTLFETGHTNGAISLTALLAGEPARSDDPGLSVRDLAERIAAGGWPAQHGRRVAAAARAARDYLEQICHVDVSRVAGSRRDPAKVQRLLRSRCRSRRRGGRSARPVPRGDRHPQGRGADGPRRHRRDRVRLHATRWHRGHPGRLAHPVTPAGFDRNSHQTG